MLIGDLPRRNRKLYPNRVAVIDGQVQLTFTEFDGRINRLANAILSFGLKQGDRVAVLYANGYRYLELYFATAKAGMVIIPLNYRLVFSELSVILEESQPELLFFGKDYWDTVQALRRRFPELQLVCIDEEMPGVTDYESLIAGFADEDPMIAIREDDLAVLGYTGGTTGRPKGVMTTHRNVVINCFQTALALGFTADDRFLSVAPLFHAGGVTGSLRFSLVGGSNVILNSSDPDVILRHIQDFGVTHLLLVPSLLHRILEKADLSRYDLSSLKCIIYGTAPMHLETLKKAMDTFQCGFAQTYGSTETFTTISVLTPKDHAMFKESQTEKLLSAGQPVCGLEVKIVDNNGREVPRGEIGEIVVRGPNVMKGYWRQPEITAEALRDGWYFTGDIGRLDDQSYLYVVDRKKDMIISGGENIYSKEVEDALLKHPAVSECAVIGVPDEVWGESVKAFVILKPGMSVPEHELIEHCKRHLASYKKPRFIEFVEDLPRSGSGKVLKNKLREAVRQNQTQHV